MRLSLIFLNLALLFLAGCRKENPTGLTLDRYRNIIDSSSLVCNGISSQYYLSAKIDGKEVCYSDGNAGYTFKNNLLTYYTTSGPDTEIGGSTQGKDLGTAFQLEAFHDTKNYVNNFTITSPNWKGTHTIKEMLEKYLIEKKYKALGINQPDSTGFNIGFYICYDRKDLNSTGDYFSFYRLPILSSGGSQDENSFLEITKVKKKVLPDRTAYDVELTFQCKLYHVPGSPEKDKFFADLTDGKMVMRFEIPD